MKTKLFPGIALALAALVLAAPVTAKTSEKATVYVTADNGAGTNLFGKLNLETGKFTEIAQTTPLFYALTTGPEGRLFGADLSTGTLFTISTTGVTTPYGSITAPGFSSPGYGFLGLAYHATKDDFLAVNVDPMHVSLYKIPRHAHTETDLGVIEGPDTGIFFNGSLAFGPFGKLYFDFMPPSGPQLYTLDPSTGAPTPVGKGLGTDILTMFSDGTQLYGIDTDTTTDIGIYIIDRKTGVAIPTGVIVTGLPKTNDYYLDTATVSPGDARCD